MPQKGFGELIRTLWRLKRCAWAYRRAFSSGDHPLVAFLIATRRCNLACSYCNEYDHVSSPVPLDVLNERVDRLGDLGTSMIVVSGGEPLLHPQLKSVIRRIRRDLRIAGLITNGYLLNPQRIEQLNRAGLDILQLSIDNLRPDPGSRKSLRLLDRQLTLLRDRAAFFVQINAVLGAEVEQPEDILEIKRRADELGFGFDFGIIHGPSGQRAPLSERHRRLYEQLHDERREVDEETWRDRLAQGRPTLWHCTAGGRYLYVDEDGLVSDCSQQRGRPGIPLNRYTPADIRRETRRVKPCAPFCTIGCVHDVAQIDRWRFPRAYGIETTPWGYWVRLIRQSLRS